MTRAVVTSVNVGKIEEVPHRGHLTRTGIFKRPVEHRVAVTADHFGDDVQADRKAHGGPDRVAYAYAGEDLQWWGEQLGRAVPAAAMGENLTTSHLDIAGASIGERWLIGSTVFEVAGLRTPCFKLAIRMGEPAFVKRFVDAGRPGAYLRVVQAGEVGAGDAIEVVQRPAHGVTMALLARAYHHDHSLASRLLAAPELAEDWREWAVEQEKRYLGRPT